MTGRRAKVAPGTRCKWCDELIRRTTAAACGVWVHADGDNIYCRTNLPGLTAKFAEPR